MSLWGAPIVSQCVFQAPMINDEDDFKSSKRGVARKEARSTKRKRRQVLKDSGEIV